MLRALALLLTAIACATCGESPHAEPRETVTTMRRIGAWEGRGNRTIGFGSDSGRFRIRWQTGDESPPDTGRFRLTVHSAVSGRPLQVVADHRGEGSGSANFEDDPREYNIMVESANVRWSVAVDELVAAYAHDAPK
jgi:hypothetical protein